MAVILIIPSSVVLAGKCNNPAPLMGIASLCIQNQQSESHDWPSLSLSGFSICRKSPDSHRYVTKLGVIGKIMTPKDVHILIPDNCEYIM